MVEYNTLQAIKNDMRKKMIQKCISVCVNKQFYVYVKNCNIEREIKIICTDNIKLSMQILILNILYNKTS